MHREGRFISILDINTPMVQDATGWLRGPKGHLGTIFLFYYSFLPMAKYLSKHKQKYFCAAHSSFGLCPEIRSLCPRPQKINEDPKIRLSYFDLDCWIVFCLFISSFICIACLLQPVGTRVAWRNNHKSNAEASNANWHTFFARAVLRCKSSSSKCGLKQSAFSAIETRVCRYEHSV